MSRTSPIPDDDTHTIFLLQRTSHQNTRTFYDYPSIVTFAQGQSLSSQTFFSLLSNHTRSHTRVLADSRRDDVRGTSQGQEPGPSHGQLRLPGAHPVHRLVLRRFGPHVCPTPAVHEPCALSPSHLLCLLAHAPIASTSRHACTSPMISSGSSSSASSISRSFSAECSSSRAHSAHHCRVQSYSSFGSCPSVLFVPLFARLDLQIFFSIRFFFLLLSPSSFFFFLLFLCLQN